MKQISLFLSIFLFLSLIFTSCTEKITQDSDTKIVLGTVCTISLFNKGTKELYDKVFSRIEEVEYLMSTSIASSDIFLANKNAGISPVSLSKETYTVLKTALNYADITNGAFNPAIGPLVKIWAIGTDSARIPAEEEIQKAKNLCNWKDVTLTHNADGYAVFLEKQDMALDLGGIAKGYAADEITKILKENGVKSALINLGGNVYAVGEKRGGSPWHIGIKNPFNSTGSPIISLELKDTSVVTSGIYERFFEHEGKRYHHLLDTKTGRPGDTGIVSVSIIHESSMIADVLSTTVFMLGEVEGIKLLESLGVKGFAINTNKHITATENISKDIIILDASFFIENQ